MAFRLYEKAAAKDHPVSCCELAAFYKHGVGCKKNLEKARIMFEKAMHLHAEEYVKILPPSFCSGTALHSL